jgi:hypothetical protein
LKNEFSIVTRQTPNYLLKECMEQIAEPLPRLVSNSSQGDGSFDPLKDVWAIQTQDSKTEMTK